MMIQDFHEVQDIQETHDIKDNQELQNIQEKQNRSGNYHRVSVLVDIQLKLHIGETFDLDTICRWMDIKERDNRNDVAEKLNYEVRRGNLEKKNRLYRYIDRSLEEIDWSHASERESVPFSWPRGRDGSAFPFDGHMTMRPTDVFVLAGTSNMGKSGICKNLIMENMDDWNGRLTYMVNEYQPSRFKRSMNLMDWNTPFNSDGSLKFKMINRDIDWQHVIDPDHLTIIDWIGLDDEFYKIGTIIKTIQKRLRDGIAVIVIQKGAGSELGVGGQFGEHYASYYWAVDNGRFLFKKAKEYHGYNPNGRTYGFSLAEGVYFNDLREVKKCGICYGKGEVVVKAAGLIQCENCEGKGWI